MKMLHVALMLKFAHSTQIAHIVNFLCSLNTQHIN